MKFYINGAYSGQNAGTFVVPTGIDWNINGVIGGTLGSNSIVDEVRIYNRALPAIEVAALYQSGSAKINSSQSPGTLASGLVGWWTMDGADTAWSSPSAGVEYDKSGNGNTGTLTSFVRATSIAIGKIGQALSFDGGNSYIKTTTLDGYLNSKSAGAISLWFKNDGQTINRPEIAGWWLSDNFRIDFNDTGAPGGNVEFYYSTSGGHDQTLTSSSAYADNKWHHAVATYDSLGSAAFYIDGGLISSRAANGAIVSGDRFCIGMACGTAGNIGLPFKGSVDDVRIYNRALSAAEVQQLYNIGAGTHVNTSSANLQNGSTINSGLVGYWTFDGATINWATGIAKDLSGQGNDGQLINMSTTTSPTIGKLGQALRVDGNTNYVSPGDVASLSFDRTSPFSVSAWVKTTSSTRGSVVSKMKEANGWDALYINSSTQIMTFLSNTWNTNAFRAVGNLSQSVTNGKWHHLVMTYDGSSQNSGVKIYSDGSLASMDYTGENSLSGSILEPGTSVRIGARTAADGVSIYVPFNGTIDDVRIYNRALSAAEVQQLYLMGK